MNLKEKTVVIENKTYRYSKIVMLSTNKKSVFKGQLVIGAGNYLFSSRESSNIGTLTAQHLYFLSTDKICEGDWIYDDYAGINNVQLVRRCDLSSCHNRNGNWYKILATTNPECNLPKPSDSFLQVYIDAYNKGEKIEECLVQYEEIKTPSQIFYSNDVPYCYIKPKITKGEITIRKVKYSWNREEVIELLNKHSDYIDSHIDYEGIASACCCISTPEWNDNDWIEENL